MELSIFPQKLFYIQYFFFSMNVIFQPFQARNHGVLLNSSFSCSFPYSLGYQILSFLPQKYPATSALLPYFRLPSTPTKPQPNRRYPSASNTFDKGLISKMYKELTQLNRKIIQSDNGGRGPE